MDIYQHCLDINCSNIWNLNHFMFLVFIFKKHLVDSEIKIHLLNKMWGIWQGLGRGTGCCFITHVRLRPYLQSMYLFKFFISLVVYIGHITGSLISTFTWIPDCYCLSHVWLVVQLTLWNCYICDEFIKNFKPKEAYVTYSCNMKEY